ncbi:MAG: MSCRAMM family protein [Candidatus Saccharimonadales bacterium]
MKLRRYRASGKRNLLAVPLGGITLFILLFLAAQPLPAQQRKYAGVVTATITCGDNGAPARYASVTLVPAPNLAGGGAQTGGSLKSSTDSNGNVTFNNVSPGVYFVDAQFAGYLEPLHLVSDQALHSKDPDVRRLVFDQIPNVTLDSASAHVAFTLERGAAISGKVIYGDNVPFPSVTITVTRVGGADSGQPGGRAAIDKKDFQARAETDDRGFYRVPGLPPGTYIASAKMGMNHLQVISTKNSFTLSTTQPGDVNLVFYAPATTERSKAQEINVGQGEERQDVDLVADLSSLHSVGGYVHSQGMMLAGAGLEMDDPQNPENRHGTLTDENGFFRFDLIPPGNYKLTAYPPTGAIISSKTVVKPKPAAAIPVVVTDADILDLSINIPAQSN